jgi:hypothetical protein
MPLSSTNVCAHYSDTPSTGAKRLMPTFDADLAFLVLPTPPYYDLIGAVAEQIAARERVTFLKGAIEEMSFPQRKS